MKDFFTLNKLPSFMRKRELRKLYERGELHFLYNDKEEIGFYCLVNETQFKSLYLKPEYRRKGLASQTIRNVMNTRQITIATTHRNCKVKEMIKKLGFTKTDQVVQGKQSELEIWVSPSLI